ncbi:MAG TPA: hypothetical protein VF747_06350 [Blastocatellia bacterium]
MISDSIARAILMIEASNGGYITGQENGKLWFDAAVKPHIGLVTTPAP